MSLARVAPQSVLHALQGKAEPRECQLIGVRLGLG
jgi:hypothetical protein